MSRVLPTLRADLALAEHPVFNASPPLDLPLSVFFGRQSSFVSEADAEGWRQETRGAVDIHWFSGDDLFINSMRQQVIARVQAQLRHWWLL
jgi:medium-chain acyl-[acyl-carrier-protein] hydrolase